MKRKEQAMAYFKEGYNCAQSVFLTFSDLTGFDQKTALRLAAPFGGQNARHPLHGIPLHRGQKCKL